MLTANPDGNHAPAPCNTAALRRRWRASTGPNATPLEREALVDALKREIQSAWETEDVRRERPSPLEEVRATLTIFDQVLWNAVPEFLVAGSDAAPAHAPGISLLARCRSGSDLHWRRSGRNLLVTSDVTRGVPA